MTNCTAGCYELARTLSRNGFVVAVRPSSDRATRPQGLRYACGSCGTRYELTPTSPLMVTA